MLTLALAGNITSVDAPTGASLNTVDVDCREQATQGGFFLADVAASAVAAGSISIAAQVSAIDSNGTTSALDIDFRETPNAGGFMTAELATALLSYAGAAAPAAPTLGTASSGTQAARNETFAVTYVDANGNESLSSPTSAEAVPLDDVASVTSPGASTGAVKYNVYGVITGGTPTLQNASPITLGTNWQEPATGLITTGRGVPTESALSIGACTVVVAQGGALAPGACTVTVQQ